MVVIKERMKF